MDIYNWSQKFSANLESMAGEYPENLETRGVRYDEDTIDERMTDFTLRSRRFVHLGEVSYKEHSDALCLAVSQTFKIEKNFSETDLGCTQAVADVIRPKLGELNLELHPNRPVKIPGLDEEMTYYVRQRQQRESKKV